jgi:hypothetical protein
MNHRRSTRLSTYAFACLALAAGAASAQELAPTWSAGDAHLRFLFHADLLRSIDLRVENGPEPLAFVAPKPSGFTFRAWGDDFENLAGGRLVAQGGFDLVRGGNRLALVGFEVRPGVEPRTLELRDARGRLVFLADHMHFDFFPDRHQLKMYNLDLRLTPEAAFRLGAPDLANLAVARLEIDLAVEMAPGQAVGEAPLACSNAQWPDGSTHLADVLITGVNSIQQVARESGLVGVTFSASLRNVGTADVAWYTKFTAPSPPYNNDQHPYLSWGMFRISSGGGTIEQIGQSALKHAFLTVNSVCGCGSGHILWAPLGGADHPSVGCEDTYGTGNNDSSGDIGPRGELESHTGVWKSLCSFFDPDCNGVQNSTPRTSTFDRRMAVVETDLQTAGATYYFEGWYVVRDDIDIYNTMGWREVTPTLGTSWTFPTVGGLLNGSVLDDWVSRTTPPPGAQHNRLVAADEAGHVEGHLSFAVKTSDAGGGVTHYEYALLNYDYDRQVPTFALALPPGTVVTNPGMHSHKENRDLALGTEWQSEITPDAVVFRAVDPAADAIDWGTLLTIRFDATAAPAAGNIFVGSYEAGTTLAPDAPTLTPGGLKANLFADGFEVGDPSRWSLVGSI